MELWDSSKTRKGVIEFCAGWDNKPRKPYDDNLIPYQIHMDYIYSLELETQGHITREQGCTIRQGLDRLLESYKNGKLTIGGYEDVQSLVESKLYRWYGSKLVGNIHLGLSRNDQIVTVMRLWMKDHAGETLEKLESLISTLKKKSKQKGNLVFVGYSHHRVAMPTTYGEQLMSYATALERDRKAIRQWFELYDECTLGVADGFGSPIKIDRRRLAGALVFKGPTKNTIDTVTTRWEAETKLADNVKVMMNHLSTIAQDFIINSMEGINIIKLPKEYCTGSSIMPQKLNPDVLETIKRKAADIEGEAFKLSSVGRGNLSGYNRDTQGTKYWIMNIFYELEGCLEIIEGVIKGSTIDEKRARELLESGGAYTAAEAVKKSIEEGVPYRKAKKDIEKKLKRRR